MPFKECCRVEERIALMRALESGAFSVTELAETFGVSRETIYQWKRRREGGDPRWFEELSRSPLRVPHATPMKAVAQILELRRRFPRFGPKKIKARLEQDYPRLEWPAVSTIGEILKRNGLVGPAARRHRRPLPRGEFIAGADVANGEWSIDFKGWFRTQDGMRIDPLTIFDTASRYLICARVTPPTYESVKAILTRIFKEVGLPDAMRSDNGPPFASTGAAGLSHLSVWLLKLRIEPRFIPPGAPQHNGRHERMHRTLKDETSYPPAQTAREQQRRFDHFCKVYNTQRPHEALGQKTPASLWKPPLRKMPATLEEPWYDADHDVRRVGRDGLISWRGADVYIGDALKHERVGLKELESGTFLVRFMNTDLGIIDRATRFHRFAPPRARLRFATKPGRTDRE